MHQRSASEKVAVAVWIAVSLGLALFGYCYPHIHSVFDVYALAGRNWWRGQDLYDPGGTTDYFRYSPAFAVAISPLAFLPPGWGNCLWRIAICLVLLAGLLSWSKQVLPRTLSAGQRTAFLLLVIPASMHSLQNAQANLLMLGAILLALAGAACERWNRAAAWLAVATLIKGYPVGLALLLGALYFRRFWLRYCVALGVGLGIPFLAQWPTLVLCQYASWFRHLIDSTVIMRERQRSLDYLLALTGHPVAPRQFLAFQILAAAAVLAICLQEYRCHTDDSRLLMKVFQWFALWVALFGPATETCTYMIVGPAIAWAVIEASVQQDIVPVHLLLISSLLLMEPLTTDVAGPALRNFANEHGSQPVGALLFLLVIGFRVANFATAAGHQLPVARSRTVI
jgi:Glycosyltransferase family 87